MKISKSGIVAVIASFAAALLVPALAIAQEEANDGPSFLLARTVNLKTSGSAEWVKLQEQLKAAQDEDSNQHRDVWEVVRGRLNTFHIVSFHNDRAGFDQQGEGGGPPLGDEQAAWVEAIGKTIASRTQSESRLAPNISIPLDEGAQPHLMTLRRVTVKPGKAGPFRAWAREQLRPALVEGGAKGFYVSQVSQGGNVDTFVFASHFANWAVLDEDGPLGHLSDEERDALFANWDDMVAAHTVDILAYRADLSY